VISSDEIDAKHVQNAWDALRQLVPRYSYSEDRAGRAVAISGHRGRSSIWLANSEQPIVLVDGVRLASQSTGSSCGEERAAPRWRAPTPELE
jgi:outer membrane cobalamin receptor